MGSRVSLMEVDEIAVFRANRITVDIFVPEYRVRFPRLPPGYIMKKQYRLLCTLKELAIIKQNGNTERLRRQARNNDIALAQNIPIIRAKRNAA